jgi:hypothetical protein
MSLQEIQDQIDWEYLAFSRLIASGELTPHDGHIQLTTANFSLFQIAGLAKALAVHQAGD